MPEKIGLFRSLFRGREDVYALRWESADGKDRRLIFSVSDYLQEIDANTGKSIHSFGNNGVVDLREGLRRDINYMRIQSGTPFM